MTPLDIAVLAAVLVVAAVSVGVVLDIWLRNRALRRGAAGCEIRQGAHVTLFMQPEIDRVTIVQRGRVPREVDLGAPPPKDAL